MSHHENVKVILGLDPGSLIAGFGCLQFNSGFAELSKSVVMLDAGVLRMKQKASAHDRIAGLFQSVDSLLDLLKPDVCVLEKAFFGQNAASALRLGEVRGAIIAACGSKKIEIAELTPTSVKKTVAGNGRASKESVSSCLETLLKFKRGALPHDVTDALGLAFAYGLSSSYLHLSRTHAQNFSKNF